MKNMKIDYITIDFTNDNFENKCSYILGYDYGGDFTKLEEMINNID